MSTDSTNAEFDVSDDAFWISYVVLMDLLLIKGILDREPSESSVISDTYVDCLVSHISTGFLYTFYQDGEPPFLHWMP